MNKKLTALLAGTTGFALALMLGQGTNPPPPRKQFATMSLDDLNKEYQSLQESYEHLAATALSNRDVVMCAAPKDGFVVAVTPDGASVVIDSSGMCKPVKREVKRAHTPEPNSSVNLRKLLGDYEFDDVQQSLLMDEIVKKEFPESNKPRTK